MFRQLFCKTLFSIVVTFDFDSSCHGAEARAATTLGMFGKKQGDTGKAPRAPEELDCLGEEAEVFDLRRAWVRLIDFVESPKSMKTTAILADAVDYSL